MGQGWERANHALLCILTNGSNNGKSVLTTNDMSDFLLAEIEAPIIAFLLGGLIS